MNPPSHTIHLLECNTFVPVCLCVCARAPHIEGVRWRFARGDGGWGEARETLTQGVQTVCWDVHAVPACSLCACVSCGNCQSSCVRPLPTLFYVKSIHESVGVGAQTRVVISVLSAAAHAERTTERERERESANTTCRRGGRAYEHCDRRVRWHLKCQCVCVCGAMRPGLPLNLLPERARNGFMDDIAPSRARAGEGFLALVI